MTPKLKSGLRCPRVPGSVHFVAVCPVRDFNFAIVSGRADEATTKAFVHLADMGHPPGGRVQPRWNQVRRQVSSDFGHAGLFRLVFIMDIDHYQGGDTWNGSGGYPPRHYV